MEESRISKLLNQDKFLRFISVLVAIMLWAYVSYVLNPETQKGIADIPVKFINEQALLNSGLILKNKEYYVDIEVKGRRNVLALLDNNRISAEIDLTRYLKIGTNRVNVKIEGIPASVKIVRDPQDIFIELAKAHSIEKEISVSIIGEPAKGYVVSKPVVKPSKVIIKGEKEVINSIHDVTAIVDVSNIQNTVISKQKLNIIDDRGNEIRDVKTSVDVVDVKVPIEREQKAKIEAK